MSPQALTAISAGAVVALIAIGVSAYVLLSDHPLPRGTGEVVAYSCKERKNVWYAVCVMKSDGSENRRLTERLTTTDPAWSPDGRQIAFTRNEDVGESTTFTDDDVFVMDADGCNVRQLTPEVNRRSSGQPTRAIGGLSRCRHNSADVRGAGGHERSRRRSQAVDSRRAGCRSRLVSVRSGDRFRARARPQQAQRRHGSLHRGRRGRYTETSDAHPAIPGDSTCIVS